MWAWACARVATLAMVPHRGRRRGEGIALTSVHIHSFSSTHQFDHTKHKTFTRSHTERPHSFTTHQHAKVTPSTRHSHLAQNTSTPTRKQSLFIHCGDLSSTNVFHRPFVSQLHVHVSRSLPARFIHMVSNYSYIYEPCMRHTTKSSCVTSGFPRARAAACVHGFYSHL